MTSYGARGNCCYGEQRSPAAGWHCLARRPEDRTDMRGGAAAT
jgi:hypothetical protein